MNLIYFMSLDLCSQTMAPIWTIFGYIILAIQIVVPLLLIISGMITMAKAVMEKDEKKIKEAQSLLIKKIIAAVLAFMVIAITKIVVNLVANDYWENCAYCALHPTGKNEKVTCGFNPDIVVVDE